MIGRNERRLMSLKGNLVFQSLCFILGALLSFVFWREIETFPVLVTQFSVIVVSLAVIIYLSIRRHRLTLIQATTIYFINLLPASVAVWLANNEFESLMRPWAPFQGHKFGVFVVALAAPPRMWIGLSVAFFVGVMTVAQYLSWPEAARVNIVGFEPWQTLISVLFAMILFVLRVRNAQLERRAVRSRIRLSVARRFMQRILALKDLSNSPLQIIEMNSAIMRKRHPEEAQFIDRIDRSLTRLKDVNRLAQKGEGDFSELRGGVGFDAKKKLWR